MKFSDKYGLPFTLLADPDHEVADAYGVWVEKQYTGKTYLGVERSTFVIDADGNVAKVMRRVKPDTHADDVLAALPSPDGAATMTVRADVAELVDAHGSGPCARKGVEVQVLSSA